MMIFDELEFEQAMTQPNIIFKNANGIELKTYFEKDTPIDLIKAYIIDDIHSLKSMKFSIIKQEIHKNQSISDKVLHTQKEDQISNPNCSPQKVQQPSKSPIAQSCRGNIKKLVVYSTDVNKPKASPSNIPNPNNGKHAVALQSVKPPVIYKPNGNTVTLTGRKKRNQKLTAVQGQISEQSIQNKKGQGEKQDKQRMGSQIATKTKSGANEGREKQGSTTQSAQSAATAGNAASSHQREVKNSESKDKQGSPGQNTNESEVKNSESKDKQGSSIQSDAYDASSDDQTKFQGEIGRIESQDIDGQTEQSNKASTEDENQQNSCEVNSRARGDESSNKDGKNSCEGNGCSCRDAQTVTNQSTTFSEDIERASHPDSPSKLCTIDLAQVATFDDLVRKFGYDFASGDIISVSYEADQKPNAKEDSSSRPVQEAVEFVPHVYDEEGIRAFESEFVPFEAVQKKFIREVRGKLESKFKCGKCLTSFTEKLTKEEAKVLKNRSDFKPQVTSESSSDERDKLFRVILISEKCKILDDDDMINLNESNDTKIYVYFVKSDMINIDKNALNFAPVCIKPFEKPAVNADEIAIIDLYDEERQIASVDLSNLDISSLTVGQLFENVSKETGIEIDDFSLFAEREGNVVFLFDQSESVQSIINSIGRSQFMFMEIQNKKSMMPRMMRNFKCLAKGSMTDDQLNHIFIHCGRSADISISTIQFYAE